MAASAARISQEPSRHIGRLLSSRDNGCQRGVEAGQHHHIWHKCATARALFALNLFLRVQNIARAATTVAGRGDNGRVRHRVVCRHPSFSRCRYRQISWYERVAGVCKHRAWRGRREEAAMLGHGGGRRWRAGREGAHRRETCCGAVLALGIGNW